MGVAAGKLQIRLGIYKHPSGCQEEKRLDEDPRDRKTRKGCDFQLRGTSEFEGGICSLKRHSQYYSFISAKWEKNSIVFITAIYKLRKLSLTKPSWSLRRNRRESRAYQTFYFIFKERRNNSKSRAVAIFLVRELER